MCGMGIPGISIPRRRAAASDRDLAARDFCLELLSVFMCSPRQGGCWESTERQFTVLAESQLAALKPLAAFVPRRAGGDDVELIGHRRTGVTALGAPVPPWAVVGNDLPPRQLNALEVHGAGQLELDGLGVLAGLLLDEPDLWREFLVRICVRHTVQILGQRPLPCQFCSDKIVELQAERR